MKSLTRSYETDSTAADQDVFGRIAHRDRRGFLRGAGLSALGLALGASIPFHRSMPSGLIPIGLAQDMLIEGKDGLTYLNDRPVNAETPAHLLNADITPTARHFIRNNGVPPQDVNADSWRLTVDGLVQNALDLSIEDLKNQFDVVTRALVIECGGNGRAAFNPPASGNQWSLGAVACSQWTGVRLGDVLSAAGIAKQVVYTAHEGADTHLSGDPDKMPISRGVPISKAMDPNNLIAFEMNGAPLHPMNGAPLRLVIPGYPGSASQKWLTRIWLRDQIHDGAKMTGKSYRAPRHPVAPGADVPKDDFGIIENMPVKSLITSLQTGAILTESSLSLHGHAWSGAGAIESVEISIDFGATWKQAYLSAPDNPFAWQHFDADLEFPISGYYEIWARATDETGASQPFAISWNPKGYLNNSVHRIAVTVEA